MVRKPLILAHDQGTSSSRAALFTCTGELISSSSAPLKIDYPANGWVEQNPKEILASQLKAMRDLEKKISESSLTIQNSKEDALKNISVEVSQLTALAAEKLTNMKIDEKQLNEEINKIDFNSKDLN